MSKRAGVPADNTLYTSFNNDNTVRFSGDPVIDSEKNGDGPRFDSTVCWMLDCRDIVEDDMFVHTSCRMTGDAYARLRAEMDEANKAAEPDTFNARALAALHATRTVR